MATALERKAARPRLDSLRSNSSYTSSNAGAVPRPPSPTHSMASSSAQTAHHHIISRNDLRQSLDAYTALMDAAKGLRVALLAKAEASAAMAGALEACSRVKGADQQGPVLQASAGFHWVSANSEQVLADTLYKSFEIPLLHSLDAYRQETVDRQAAYETVLVEKTRAIRATEEANLRQGRKRGGLGRDLTSFRQTLAQLQGQVDELDRLKAEYYGEVLDGEDASWETIVDRVGLVLKVQLEMYHDRMLSKGNDPILEPLLAANPDPFEAYTLPSEDGPSSSAAGNGAPNLFSILPPIGILPTTSSSSSSSSTNLMALHRASRANLSSTTPKLGSFPTSSSSVPSPRLPSTTDATDSPPSDSDDGFLSPRSKGSFSPRPSSPPPPTTSLALPPSDTEQDDDRTPRRAPSSSSASSLSSSTSSLAEEPSPTKPRPPPLSGLRKMLSVIGERASTEEPPLVEEEGDAATLRPGAGDGEVSSIEFPVSDEAEGGEAKAGQVPANDGKGGSEEEEADKKVEGSVPS